MAHPAKAGAAKPRVLASSATPHGNFETPRRSKAAELPERERSVRFNSGAAYVYPLPLEVVMHRFLLQASALAGAFLLGCTGETTEPSLSAPGVATAGVVVVNEHTHFIDEVLVSSCTGEEIPTTGTVHEVLSITETGPGVVKIVAHLQVHARGTSPTTGASLRIHRILVETFPDVSVPAEGTTEDVLTVIAKGSAPNERIRFKYHLTINANGTVTSSFEEFTITCQ
jgi:hypothetical protein